MFSSIYHNTNLKFTLLLSSILARQQQQVNVTISEVNIVSASARDTDRFHSTEFRQL
eukprot:SAG31_NODE_244_length_19246_cov_20.233823_12_plen_57_part_00